MLLVTVVYIAILFVYGNPEWRPLVAAYLGLLLMGGAFLSIGLLISSTDQESDRGGHHHLRGVPDVVDRRLVR